MPVVRAYAPPLGDASPTQLIESRRPKQGTSRC
ncbi:hypothetical protein CKAH01_11539 [Colletotrichum kahawae]|uniref:Uncharacterized protein n=1 Tax=Colletotrichum kahawae TaxID=34407 RepID=A0AAD9YTD5_COLKA|nr:hypothetical protein CKAH01_11539 [Colletotrichum kahawae]